MSRIEGQRREGSTAVITGTGGSGIDLRIVATEKVRTRWGDVNVRRCQAPGGEFFWLARHGRAHNIAPHLINYQANVAALAMLGVERIVATNACGGLSDGLEPGDCVVVDQFLDFTRHRPLTFFDSPGEPVVHTDFSEPYCPALRATLVSASEALGLTCRSTGTYVCCDGPRYETAAEVRMFRMLGGDLIGMTAIPELVLAREIGICYAGLAVVTNVGAGLAEGTLTHEEVEKVMRSRSAEVRRVLVAAATSPYAPCAVCNRG